MYKFCCINIYLIFTCLSQNTLAAEATRLQTEAISYSQIMNLVLGLGIVLVAFFCIVYVLKRLSGVSGISQGHLKIVDALPVSTRERLLLVRVADTYLLLGVSPGSINALHVLDQKLEDKGIESVPDFKAQFRSLFGSAKTRSA